METDTCRSSGVKGDGERHHEGRLLVLKGRLKKNWVVHSLPKKVSTGSRGGAPESKAEVARVLQKHLGKAVIVASDGVPAWKNAAQGHAHLKGVSHLRHIFTPSSQLQKKDVDAASMTLLRNHSKGSRRLARKYEKHWTLAAGDNAAESLLGHVKNTGRRLQTIGRTGTSELKEVQLLAAAHLLRSPGLDAIFDAHGAYRRDCLLGKLHTTPSQCYAPKFCSWLANVATGSRPSALGAQCAKTDSTTHSRATNTPPTQRPSASLQTRRQHVTLTQ